jgi:RNA polymerase sigma factor (sigma-70 family)
LSGSAARGPALPPFTKTADPAQLPVLFEKKSCSKGVARHYLRATDTRAHGGLRMNHTGLEVLLRRLRTLAEASAAGVRSDAELLGRFVGARDEAAFAALVERHGLMVLRLCRRILGHAQDAEDAYQATFLVLVRNAASIRKRGSLASWLFGVAARTSRMLRQSRVRNEGRAGICEGGALTPGDDPSWREVRTIVDEELLRLPEKYRAPLVLCYLEGLTRDEAAVRLGLSRSRLRGRLDYGRGLLRGRLARRGVGLSAVLLAGLLTRDASAALPALLAISTVKAAALTAVGRALPPGLVPTRVVALTEGMVRTMPLIKLKGVCAALLLVAGLGVGVGAALQADPADRAAGEQTKKAARADPPPKAVHPYNKALEGLARHYALPDGEVLKAFRPPHPEERKEFFRVVRPPNDQTEWDGNLDLNWKNGRLEFGTVSFGNPPRGQSVASLLRTLAGILPEEVEGDKDLRWNAHVPGDFVVREGAAPAKVVARLEEILNQEYGLPVRLTLRQADRTFYVLEGKYKFTPAAAGLAENHIELYARERGPGLAPPSLPGVERGAAFADFVAAVGRFLDRRVVLGKTEGLPAAVSWQENPAEPFPEVLQRVTEQTGLTVREETRHVRVLIVERKK